ncbi:MAG: hypothetical protein J6M02_00225 [Clostridia bacterium]|nr:hypothetical protein [Clostridia bacterium]
MNDEKSYTYHCKPEVCELNENNVLKPYAYPLMIAKIIEEHLINNKWDIGITSKYGLAWALTSMSIQLNRPIKGNPELTAKTWASSHKGPLYQRDFEFYQGNDVIFCGTSFSFLLDLQTRSIYRKKETPFGSITFHEEHTIEATHSFKPIADFQTVAEKQVQNSYIDVLGHVNNYRYTEFAYDVLTDEEIANLENLKRIDIYFLSELSKKDIFEIKKSNQNNQIIIQGCNKTKEKISFHVIFSF